VVRAVEKRHLHIYYRIARQDSIRKRLDDALLDRWNVLAGNDPALDGVDEFETFSLRLGFYLEHYVAVLTAASRLLDELAFDFLASLPYRFAVSHLRFADSRLDAEFALHAIDQDFEV